MWKIKKISLQLGLELMTTRMMDEVLANWTKDAGYTYKRKAKYHCYYFFAQAPENGPCNSGEYYPVPGSCESFAICVNGRKMIQRCAHGLQWNQQMKICDWARNVMCGVTTERIANEAKENLQNRPCQSGTYAPYPGDCNRYGILFFLPK